MKLITETVANTTSALWKGFKKLWGGAALTLGSLLLIGIIFSLIGMAVGSSAAPADNPLRSSVVEEGSAEETIAVVPLSGMIIEEVDQSGPFAASSGVVESRKVARSLDRLVEDDQVKAIVLRINSPGGTVVASDELYDAVRRASREKVVIASLADTAASGGYYIALGADEIIAHPATLTGSIGVIAQFPELTGLFETLGVDVRTFKSGEYKDLGSATREISDEERDIIQSLIDDSYEQFLTAVIESRDLDEQTARDLADGRVYSGVQAVENNLADREGGYRDSLQRAQELAELDDPRVVEYSAGGFVESLLGAVVPWEINADLRVATKTGLFYIYQ